MVGKFLQVNNLPLRRTNAVRWSARTTVRWRSDIGHTVINKVRPKSLTTVTFITLNTNDVDLKVRFHRGDINKAVSYTHLTLPTNREV